MNEIIKISPENTKILKDRGHKEVMVTMGTLVLVPAMLQYAIDKNWMYIEINGKYYFPLIVSRKEKLTEGDLIYDQEHNDRTDKIFTLNSQNYFYATTKRCFKILATPNNFNTVYRGKIRNKILRHWDDVYVKCELETAENSYEAISKDFKCIIVYDNINHIKLYDTQERSYKKSEIIEILNKFGNHILDTMRLDDIGGKLKSDKAKDWFEENIE